MASVKKGNIDKVYKSWNETMFPENRLNSIQYLKQATEKFKKFENLNLKIVDM